MVQSPLCFLIYCGHVMLRTLSSLCDWVHKRQRFSRCKGLFYPINEIENAPRMVLAFFVSLLLSFQLAAHQLPTNPKDK